MHNYSIINETPIADWQRIIGSIAYKLGTKFRYEDVEDLSQEAWPILYHAASKFDRNKNVKFITYATVCITRHLLRYLKKKYRTQISIDDEFDIEDHRVDDTKLRKELLKLMEDDPLLKAYFLEGKTYAAIAKDTQQYPGTAYKKVKLAIQDAKTKLSEDY
jgi:RNA polymerase sigma factor (sigma-70 family)